MNPLRMFGSVVWLTTLWVALWHDLSVANLVSGVGIAALVLVISGLPGLASRDDDRPRIRPVAAITFVLFVTYKLVEANLLLALEILTPRNRINVGVVAVPLRTRSETVTLIIANVITLTPGSLVIESSGSPAVLYVNVLHLRDVEQVRRQLLQIEHLAVRAFGSASDRAVLAQATAP